MKRSVGNLENVEISLQAAFDNRAKFIVVFSEKQFALPSINCTLLNFDTENVCLEASSLNKALAHWEGAQVVCYFKLPLKSEDNEGAFLNFTARIKKIRKSSAGYVELVIDRPINLDIGQRRKSMRITPVRDLLMGFYLWNEEHFIRRKQQGEKPGLHPPLLYLDHIEAEKVEIPDISAGGIKLRLPWNSMEDIGNNWKKGKLFIIWIALLEPSKGVPVKYWLRAKIKHNIQDPQTKALDLGLEFMHFGKIDESQKLKWFKVQDNVIDDLAAWTQKRYLEQYRKLVSVEA